MLILLQLVVAGAMGRRNYYFGGSETQANTARREEGREEEGFLTQCQYIEYILSDTLLQ